MFKYLKFNLAIYTGLALILIIGLAANYQRLMEQARNYAINSTEKNYGSEPIDHEKATEIQAIATEIGLLKPIKICKMNSTSMQQFGDSAIAACLPCCTLLIPIFEQPYLLIGGKFFNTFSPAEQRFLIGRELVRIKQNHTYKMNLLGLALFFLCFMIFWKITKPLRLKLKKFRTRFIYKNIAIALSIGLLSLSLVRIAPYLLNLTYRRHIERELDRLAIELLSCHEGALKVISRQQQEYHYPEHNPYLGLLSDRPSCHERRIYCLESQLQKEHDLQNLS